MKIAVVYCYPLVSFRTYYPLADRFARTFRQFTPALAHELHVVCNGGGGTPADLKPFEGLHVHFHQRDNFGWDIGAFQYAAESIPADLMVFLGAPVHFHKPGWLERMADAYIENGPHLYGCWAYLSPNWHVRTTVFWCHPDLLNTYPNLIGTGRRDRYEFEHGKHSFTRHVIGAGLECIMVTWHDCFPFREWQRFTGPPVVESLVLDQHTHQ